MNTTTIQGQIIFNFEIDPKVEDKVAFREIDTYITKSKFEPHKTKETVNAPFKKEYDRAYECHVGRMIQREKEIKLLERYKEELKE